MTIGYDTREQFDEALDKLKATPSAGELADMIENRPDLPLTPQDWRTIVAVLRSTFAQAGVDTVREALKRALAWQPSENGQSFTEKLAECVALASPPPGRAGWRETC